MVVALNSAARRGKPQTKEERASELAVLEREIVRAERRLLAETLIGCVACCAMGLFLMGWAVHTTDAGWGGIAFWSGFLIGDVGMFGMLLRHAHRSEVVGL